MVISCTYPTQGWGSSLQPIKSLTRIKPGTDTLYTEPHWLGHHCSLSFAFFLHLLGLPMHLNFYVQLQSPPQFQICFIAVCQLPSFGCSKRSQTHHVAIVRTSWLPPSALNLFVGLFSNLVHLVPILPSKNLSSLLVFLLFTLPPPVGCQLLFIFFSLNFSS